MCNICGSNRNLLLLKTDFYSLLKGRNCGVIYQVPQINKEEYLKKITEYYEKVDPSELVAISRRRLYNNFFSKIEHLHPRRILDIGCGFGYFLSLTKEKGWNCYGVEVSETLARMGKQRYNLNIETIPFEENDYSNDYFDVITLCNVLDEMMSPIKVLKEIKRILAPNGILFIRIPNADFHIMIYRIHSFLSSIGLGKLVTKKVYIFHIFNFSNIALQKLLKRSHFAPINVLSSLPTSGAPYSILSSDLKVYFFKKIIYFIAQFVYFLSFRKITLAPSIEVFARKTDD
ncbi:MAG: class I SAM-dependent methyltransferase [bacterium]|nr:class I SAM-dependent methyltransferase [bacterium]